MPLHFLSSQRPSVVSLFLDMGSGPIVLDVQAAHLLVTLSNCLAQGSPCDRDGGYTWCDEEGALRSVCNDRNDPFHLGISSNDDLLTSSDIRLLFRHSRLRHTLFCSGLNCLLLIIGRLSIYG